MSHFTVYVFSKENGGDLEELLMPYDENMECEPYVKYTREEAIAEVRREIEQYKNTTYAEYVADPEAYKEKHDYADPRHFDYLENEFPKRLEWTDEECFEDMKKWYDEEDIDEDGNIYSTYNPKSKWDWYVIGGRWSTNLKTKNGDEVDVAYAKEENREESGVPFAFITPDGKWYERGEMGWWAVVTNEKSSDDWDTEFYKMVEKLDNDVVVTLVDCHI